MKRQRGVALITVLLVVALASLVTAGLVLRQQVSIRSSTNQLLARQAWRLSPAETALLRALLRGQTPQDFADARRVRIRTVRTQLSALLLKTGAARQQDLVALVARLLLLAPDKLQN